jgi:hypothetical protein
LRDAKPTILAYAAEVPAPDGVQWRNVGPGRSALLVPPPVLWRLLAWRTMKLLLLLPFVLFAVLWAIAALLYGQGLAFGMSAMIAIVGVGAWTGTLLQVTAIARHGRKPFAIEVEYARNADGAAPGQLRISPPEWDAGRDDVSEAFSGKHVTDVRIEPLSPGVFYGMMRLYLAFTDGTAISTDIPCRHGEPSQPIEEQLRHVLLPGARAANAQQAFATT